MSKLTELAEQNGLNIKDFYGKWQKATEMAFADRTDTYPESSAAEYACRLFLELGGEYNAPPIQRTNHFKITPHDDGIGLTVSCDLIGSHIRIEPVSLTTVVITADDRENLLRQRENVDAAN